jgi:hypothetical protein
MPFDYWPEQERAPDRAGTGAFGKLNGTGKDSGHSGTGRPGALAYARANMVGAANGFDSGCFTKRIVDYQIRYLIKIPLVPGYEGRIQRQGRGSDDCIGKGDIYPRTEFNGFLSKGISKRKAPGTIKKMSCLGKSVRSMIFPAEKFDSGDNWNVKRFLKDPVNDRFLLVRNCAREVIDEDIGIDQIGCHPRFHSLRRARATSCGFLTLSRYIP